MCPSCLEQCGPTNSDPNPKVAMRDFFSVAQRGGVSVPVSVLAQGAYVFAVSPVFRGATCKHVIIIFSNSSYPEEITLSSKVHSSD
jgi:hypothetical protein